MKVVLKYLLLFSFILLGSFVEHIMEIYKDIVLSNNLIVLLVTLIAGLFGFMVAVIPFAIQLFNQDNTNKKNTFLNKLMKKDKFDFFVKPMFHRFIRMLYTMLFLFIYVFFISILQTIDLKSISFLYVKFLYTPLYQCGILLLFYIYTILVIEFFLMLRYIRHLAKLKI